MFQSVDRTVCEHERIRKMYRNKLASVYIDGEVVSQPSECWKLENLTRQDQRQEQDVRNPIHSSKRRHPYFLLPVNS